MAKAPTKSAPANASATAVINIDKNLHGAVVVGAVNGQAFKLSTGKDVAVSDAQHEAMSNSGITFTTVSPPAGEDAAEGSAASSTVENTAIRDEVPTEVDGDTPPTPPELRQITDAELTGGADQKASAENT